MNYRRILAVTLICLVLIIAGYAIIMSTHDPIVLAIGAVPFLGGLFALLGGYYYLWIE